MLKEELNVILQEIWKDREFIEGVQSCLETDEAQQEMLDVMKNVIGQDSRGDCGLRMGHLYRCPFRRR